MKPIEVLLINPPVNHPKGVPIVYGRHLGLAYIASSLRQKGHKVDIVDCIIENMSVNSLVELLVKKNADLVGFTVYQGAAKYLSRILSELEGRKISSHITAGGIFPTIMYMDLLTACPRLNSVCLGEGEHALPDLAEAIAANRDWTDINGLAFYKEGRVYVNELRPLIQDLDNLPFPSIDSLDLLHRDNRLRHITLVSSRGCYGNCTFCHTPTYYKRFSGQPWRPRSGKNVADEIESVTGRYPVSHISFYDDTFFGAGEKGKTRAVEVANEIKSRNFKITYSIESRVNDVDEETFLELKNAGLVNVFLGVESISRPALKVFNKGITPEQTNRAIMILEKLGINYSIGYILFNPYTKLDELLEGVRFWRTIKNYPKNSTVGFGDRLFLLKGSGIENKMQEDGLLLSKDLFSGYDINYRFMEHETQQAFDIFNQLADEYIYPLISNNYMDEATLKGIHDYKIELLQSIIDQCRSNAADDLSIKVIRRSIGLFSRMVNKNLSDMTSAQKMHNM